MFIQRVPQGILILALRNSTSFTTQSNGTFLGDSFHCRPYSESQKKDSL